MFAASKHMDIYLSISLFIGFQSLLQTQLRIGWLFLYCLYLLFSYPFFHLDDTRRPKEGEKRDREIGMRFQIKRAKRLLEEASRLRRLISTNMVWITNLCQPLVGGYYLSSLLLPLLLHLGHGQMN